MPAGCSCASTEAAPPRLALPCHACLPQEAVAAPSWLAAKSVQLGERGQGRGHRCCSYAGVPSPRAAMRAQPSDAGRKRIHAAVSIMSQWTPPSACAGTLAVVAAMSQTWLHPLLKKVLPAQGEVSKRGQGRAGQHRVCRAAVMCGCVVGWLLKHCRRPGCRWCGGVAARRRSSGCDCCPPPSLLQGPSRDTMLNGFFKNRVLAWSKEEGGAEPELVQASWRGGTCRTPRCTAEAAAHCAIAGFRQPSLLACLLPSMSSHARLPTLRRRWATRTATAATGEAAFAAVPGGCQCRV